MINEHVKVGDKVRYTGSMGNFRYCKVTSVDGGRVWGCWSDFSDYLSGATYTDSVVTVLSKSGTNSGKLKGIAKFLQNTEAT